MRKEYSLFVLLLAAAVLLFGGCRSSQDMTATAYDANAGTFPERVTVPAGVTLHVRLNTTVSSKVAEPGDTWTGTVAKPVVIEGHEVIAAGSPVQGTVVNAEGAQRGSRARLELGVRTVRVDDRKTVLHADAEPVIAGSTRARNVGAIVGGAAAGAILGQVIGGDGGDAAKGAVVGSAVATGAVAASKGYQVVLEDGTVMNFVVRQDVALAVR
jgi:hypothetical protein